MKNLKKFLSVALTGALALALLFGNIAFPMVAEAIAAPIVTPLPLVINMTDVLPESEQYRSTVENNYDFSNIRGWSNAGDDEIRLELVGPNGVGIALPTLGEFLANSPESRSGISALEHAVAVVFPDLTLEEVAFLEVDGLHSAAREVVLLARYSFVFGNDVAWTVDGQMEIVNADGTVQELPEFSALFPNWDLAQIVEAHSNSDVLSIGNQAVSDTFAVSPFNVIFNQLISVPLQSNVQAPIFQRFHNNTGFIANLSVRIESINLGGPFVNIGANNVGLPGEPSVGWVGGLMAGQAVRITNIPNNALIGLRASMTQRAGTARISVTRV